MNEKAMAKMTFFGKTAKWSEVGYLSTNDPEEKLTVIAKFIFHDDAKIFAEWYNKTHAGIVEIIVR